MVLFVGTKPADYLDFRRHGKVDGSGDYGSKLIDWITDCSEKKIRGYMPSGLYETPALDITIINDLNLVGDGYPVIKGIPTINDSVLMIRSATNLPSVRVQGITFDNSMMPYIPADASGTAFSMIRIAAFHIVDCQFLSADDYDDEFGDSGISSVLCNRGLIEHCYFKGQPDNGVYLSGGEDPLSAVDNSFDFTVRDCTFYRCAHAAKINRQGRRTIFTNNFVNECRGGFSNGAMTLGTNNPGGYELIVTGNYFKRLESRAVDAQGPCKVTFCNNQICDWGYDLAGVASAFSMAVRICEPNGIYTGNIFWFENWAGTTRRAFHLQQETDTGGTYTPTGNLIDGNTIIGADVGIFEQTNVTGNSGTNYLKNVATPATLATGSTSKYSVRKDDGTVQPYFSALSVARASPTDATVVGAGITSTGIVYASASGTAPARLTRLVSEGAVLMAFKDAASRGNLSTTAAFGGGLALLGSVQHPTATVAQLQANTGDYAASGANRVMVNVTDAPAGQRYAYSNAAAWFWVSNSAAV